MLEWNEPGREHAVQLVTFGSQFDMFITFRDILLKNPKMVTEYNQIKERAAHMAESEYRAAKSQFIERILSEHRK